MAIHKIETIPLDAKVKMEIPGSFYGRIQQLLMSYSATKSQEELQASLKKLAGDEAPADEFEYHLFTLTIFSHEIEKAAKAQGLTVMEEIDIPED